MKQHHTNAGHATSPQNFESHVVWTMHVTHRSFAATAAVILGFAAAGMHLLPTHVCCPAGVCKHSLNAFAAGPTLRSTCCQRWWSALCTCWARALGPCRASLLQPADQIWWTGGLDCCGRLLWWAGPRGSTVPFTGAVAACALSCEAIIAVRPSDAARLSAHMQQFDNLNAQMLILHALHDA